MIIIFSLVVVFLSIFFGFTVYLWAGGAPYATTPQRACQKMVSFLKDGLLVYDLGSGDGRILFEAGKRYKVLALGFEQFLPCYLFSKIKNLFTKKKGIIKILFKNFWHQNLKGVDVIFCFLMPHSMEKIGEKFQKEAKEGAKLISYCFEIKKMKPIKIIKEEGIAPIYVYQKESIGNKGM